jgi:hypothetical protein
MGASVARPDASKVVVLSFVLAIAFAIGMYALVSGITDSSRRKALAQVNAEVEQKEQRQGPSLLDEAAAVASPFVADVGAGRFADAHALLAAPYRAAVTPAALANACRASPILSGARAVTLNRLRQQAAGTAATVEASGVLDSGAGAVPVGFVFLKESGRLRILVLSLAGVPVLQGVASR